MICLVLPATTFPPQLLLAPLCCLPRIPLRRKNQTIAVFLTGSSVFSWDASWILSQSQIWLVVFSIWFESCKTERKIVLLFRLPQTAAMCAAHRRWSCRFLCSDLFWKNLTSGIKGSARLALGCLCVMPDKRAVVLLTWFHDLETSWSDLAVVSAVAENNPKLGLISHVSVWAEIILLHFRSCRLFRRRPRKPKLGLIVSSNPSA